MKRTKYSLYSYLGLIIVAVVVCVVTMFSTISYFSVKSRIVEEIQLHSEVTITSLQKSVAPYIEAYAVNEYETLIFNEMGFDDFYAIIVTDYYMGGILGQGAYISGKIRDADWNVMDYDPENRELSRALDSCFDSVTATMVSASGSHLGTITICNSDRSVVRELKETIIENILYAASISLLLFILLFFTINRVVLRPVSAIVDGLVRSDESGIPLDKVPTRGPREIGILATSINRIIDAVHVRERELLESEAWSRLLLDSTAEGIYGIDLEGNCTFANEMCLKLIGYQHSDEMIGKDMHALIHHSHSDGSPYPVKDCHIYRANSEGKSTHVDSEVFWRSNGASFYAEYASFPIRKEGVVIGSVVTFSDISERRSSEEKIRMLSEAMLHAVDGIVILNRQGIIEYINAAFLQMTGYTEDEVLNHKYSDFVRMAAEYENLWYSIDSGHSMKDDIDFPRKDGTLFPVLLSSAPIRNAESVITHHVVVQTDMSEYKALEDKFVQSQKMEALGTLVGGIAHDFNNLLSGILGTLYLVKRDPKFDSSLEKQLDTVTDLGYQAANLVKSLLAFARKESVEMKPFPLVPFVKETMKLHRMAIPENIVVRSDIGNVSFSILADANRLQQVILNLMTNAAYALKGRESPEIRISLSAFEADQSFKKLHPEIKSSEFAHLVVTDNGCGIEKKHLQHLFEPFYTTKPVGEGSGLGLAMVYGVVQAHHGVVEFKSEVGVGTEAHVYLPVIDESAHVMSDSIEPEVKGNGELILLVDDNELVLNTLSGTLKQLNYQVIEAMDGQEAVDLFKQKGKEIDIVVTDIVMPVMGGIESARMIKELSEETPIIFLTGYHSEEISDDLLNADNVVKLTKPVTQSLLSHTIQQLLHQEES